MTIIIQRAPCGFVAAHYSERGGPDARIVDAFGTHVIPTPFRPSTDPVDVLERLRDLNPDSTVDLSDELWNELAR